MFGDLPELFKDEDELRALWSKPDPRKGLLAGLEDKGYGKEQLREASYSINAEKSDLYDVLAYIAFALPTITREERVEMSQGNIFHHYFCKQREFLDFVLEHYVNQGVRELDKEKLPDLLEQKNHSIPDAVTEMGSVADIRNVYIGFQQHLYAPQPAA